MYVMCDALGTFDKNGAIDRASERDLDMKDRADKTIGQNPDIGWSVKAFVKTDS